MPARELISTVHEALLHLYETEYLRSSPLGDYLAAEVASVARGDALYRRLRGAIEQLAPPTGTPQHALAWRHYRCLTLRHVHALTLHQVAAELGITERHCRRIHREALERLTHLLLGLRWVHPPDQESERTHSSQWLLESELSRFATIQEPPVSLCETVKGVMQTLLALARTSNTTLSMSIDSVRDAIVDRAVVRQVVLNLLVHAIHSQPGGHIHLLPLGDPPSVGLVIVVRPPSERAPADLAAISGEKHVVIARRLAEMHGATVGVERTSREIRFDIAFPARRPRTVLMIDDNPDFLRLFRRFLAGSGYKVLEATGGNDAFRMAREERPDIITLDILLPGQDGWEILQLLKHRQPTSRIPVVVCSVLGDRDLALSLGAADFLAKPVGQAALLATLDRCGALLLEDAPNQITVDRA